MSRQSQLILYYFYNICHITLLITVLLSSCKTSQTFIEPDKLYTNCIQALYTKPFRHYWMNTIFLFYEDQQKEVWLQSISDAATQDLD